MESIEYIQSNVDKARTALESNDIKELEKASSNLENFRTHLIIERTLLRLERICKDVWPTLSEAQEWLDILHEELNVLMVYNIENEGD